MDSQNIKIGKHKIEMSIQLKSYRKPDIGKCVDDRKNKTHPPTSRSSFERGDSRDIEIGKTQD